MATKNCPKCDSPNPVACKKCACGHVFFATRRSANTLAAESAEDISEPTTPQEPEIPRRRTARVTRERPQFYDALQVENQTRRQRELQKRRKASKSDEVDVSAEDVPEKVPVASTAKRRAESPPSKVYEQPVKKRRGRPPGLTNRKTGRAQILSNKPSDTKTTDGTNVGGEDELENVANIHDVPPLKALQMNLVLSDINSRISSSGVKAEAHLPPAVDSDVSDASDAAEKEVEEPGAEPMECEDTIKQEPSTEPSKTEKKEPIAVEKVKVEKLTEDAGPVELEEKEKNVEIVEAKTKKPTIEEETEDVSGEEAEAEIPLDVKKEIVPVAEEKMKVHAILEKKDTNEKSENVECPTEKLQSDDLKKDKNETETTDSKNGANNALDDKPAKAEVELKEEPIDDSSDLKETKVAPKLESSEEPTEKKDVTDTKPATGTNGVNNDDTGKSKAEQVPGLTATPTESTESKICSP